MIRTIDTTKPCLTFCFLFPKHLQCLNIIVADDHFTHLLNCQFCQQLVYFCYQPITNRQDTRLGTTFTSFVTSKSSVFVSVRVCVRSHRQPLSPPVFHSVQPKNKEVHLQHFLLCIHTFRTLQVSLERNGDCSLHQTALTAS